MRKERKKINEKDNDLLENKAERLARQASKEQVIQGSRRAYTTRSDGTLGSGLKTWLFDDSSMIIWNEDDEFAMGMSMIGYNKRKRLIADWKAGKLKSRMKKG